MFSAKIPELVGGVLFESTDPASAAVRLAEVLTGARRKDGEFDPALVNVLRRRVVEAGLDVDLACALGAAWVLGRRSIPESGEWELVATVPSHTGRPSGITRTTAETLISLVGKAVRRVRLAAPFITESGLALLVEALVAATKRGVGVEMLLSDRNAIDGAVLRGLLESVRERGDLSHVSLVVMGDEGPWSHMKVVIVDGETCYIGSANLTGAGLGYRNLELGVLLRGDRVEIVDAVLDIFQGADTSERLDL